MKDRKKRYIFTVYYPGVESLFSTCAIVASTVWEAISILKPDLGEAKIAPEGPHYLNIGDVPISTPEDLRRLPRVFADIHTEYILLDGDRLPPAALEHVLGDDHGNFYVPVMMAELLIQNGHHIL
ncbi:MAG: hypothetical protein WCT32_04270 [Patescibacteria group bacterium]|jgi:hypothetical protein